MPLRTNKLVQPKFQLSMVSFFITLSVFSLVFQFLYLMEAMTEMALSLPADAELFFVRFPSALLKVLLVSLGTILPITLIVGVLVTHRVAGPLHRMQKFMESVQRGERPKDCSLRKGDHLKDFCRLLNETTAPLRSPVATDDEAKTAA